MVDAGLPQKILLPRPRRSEHLQLSRFGQLCRSHPNASSRAVNKDAVAFAQISHLEHRMVGRQIIHRDCRSLFERHSRGQGKHRRRRTCRNFHIAIKFRHGHHAVASLEPATPRRAFHYTGDLKARNERRFRRAGIKTHALQQIGEINPYGLHPYQALPGLRLWLRPFPVLQNARIAIPPNHYCTHLTLLGASRAFLGVQALLRSV